MSPFFTAERGCKKWLNQRWPDGDGAHNQTKQLVSSHTHHIGFSVFLGEKQVFFDPTNITCIHPPPKTPVYINSLCCVYITFGDYNDTSIFSAPLHSSIPQHHALPTRSSISLMAPQGLLGSSISLAPLPNKYSLPRTSPAISTVISLSLCLCV